MRTKGVVTHLFYFVLMFCPTSESVKQSKLGTLPYKTGLALERPRFYKKTYFFKVFKTRSVNIL
jgi:hypothetical protein